MIGSTKDIIDKTFLWCHSVRKATHSFRSNEMTGKKWIESMHPKRSQLMAKHMIKKYGVKGLRDWFNRHLGENKNA